MHLLPDEILNKDIKKKIVYSGIQNSSKDVVFWKKKKFIRFAKGNQLQPLENPVKTSQKIVSYLWETKFRDDV